MKHRRALVNLHAAAVLFGSTALFGVVLRASPHMIVLGRTLFAVLALGIAAAFLRAPRHRWRPLTGTDRKRLLLAGGALALHWTTFFMAVRQGGVALATLGFASFPVFVALLEAAVLRERPCARDAGVLLLVMSGMVLITPAFSLADQGTAGLLWGIISGALYAGIAVANRYRPTAASGSQACWWQCLAALLLLAPFGWREAITLNWQEWLILACLGAICTGLAYTLFLQALQQVRAQTVAIVISMEPVYAIALAWLWFGETPGPSVLLGGALVVAAVLVSSLAPKHQPA